MKRAAILCFSDRGAETAERVKTAVEDRYDVRVIRPRRGELRKVTGREFAENDALIFVGSCGIAVRAIAPYVVHKTEDPAVVVCDELGFHVVSLLSGHIGGANALTGTIAKAIGAEPVITTATDINKRFSADAWAARNGLYIEPIGMIKRFSGELLKRDLPMFCETPTEGALPGGIYRDDIGDVGVSISVYGKRPFAETLLLVPRIIHIGVGCKRGMPAEAILSCVNDTLGRRGLHPQSLKAIASIDVKADEKGLIETAEALHVPFRTYSADELNALPGTFTVSEFVNKTVGVDCVCERAAVYSAGNGAALIQTKTKYSGVTCAVAIEDWRACFE